MDSIVTSAERELASSLRAVEDDAEGDLRLEAELLERLLEPEVSPLLVASFDGWPNTYVASCEFDPTRDDGLLFVRRMRRSGAAARVAHKHYPHYMLGFMLMMREPVVQRDLAAFLRQNPDFF